jgi:hypothetical protein
MNILVAIVLFGLLFWKIKNNYINRTTLAYSYSLKALEEKLDMLVVKNKLKIDDNRYRTLSSNICNLRGKLESLNLTVLFVYYLRDRKNKSRPVSKPSVATISKKDQRINLEISKIEKELKDGLFAYIITKNVGFRFIVMAHILGVKPIKRISNRLSAKLKDYLQYYIEKTIYRQNRLTPFTV